MKKLFLFAAAVLMAAPAFAAVQNVKVSGDIDSWYVNRQEFNLGAKDASGTGIETAGLQNQSAFLTQTRLRVDADLSDNVSTTVRLINERSWGKTTTGGSTTGVTAGSLGVYLDLANVTLREFLYSPLTVTVGRQEFSYGNGLILGGNGPNNATTGNLASVAADLAKLLANDGVKLVLDYKPLTLDLIYFKNNGGTTGLLETNKTQSDVYGVNANYQLGDAMNSVVEAYIFSKVEGQLNATTGGSNNSKGDIIWVPGLRVSTNPVKGLNTQAEIAWQGGTKAVNVSGTGVTPGADSVHRSAFAAQAMASYQLPVLEKYKPVAAASYTYVSGDKNGTDRRQLTFAASRATYTAWDPLFERQNGGTIYNSLFNLTNLQIITASLQANPLQDVTTKLTWSNLNAARKVSSTNPLTINQPDGTSSPSIANTSRKDMGNEYDVNVDYAYTEDVTFGLSLGWYVPGKLFTSANDSTASQALAHVNVNF